MMIARGDVDPKPVLFSRIKPVTSIACDRDYVFAESTDRLGLPLDRGRNPWNSGSAISSK